MRKTFAWFLLAAVGLEWSSNAVWAQVTTEALANESIAACEASASVKPTPDMVKAKVDEACELINKEGAAAFAKLQGKDSPFIFAGTYIWINDFDGIMLMHPIKYKMNGNNILQIKDSNGRLFFTDFIEVCKSKGSGWVDYLWPKPGEKAPSQKISYVKKAVCDGKDVVVGCGIYDVSPEEMAQLTK